MRLLLVAGAVLVARKRGGAADALDALSRRAEEAAPHAHDSARRDELAVSVSPRGQLEQAGASLAPGARRNGTAASAANTTRPEPGAAKAAEPGAAKAAEPGAAKAAELGAATAAAGGRLGPVTTVREPEVHVHGGVNRTEPAPPGNASHASVAPSVAGPSLARAALLERSLLAAKRFALGLRAGPDGDWVVYVVAFVVLGFLSVVVAAWWMREQQRAVGGRYLTPLQRWTGGWTAWRAARAFTLTSKHHKDETDSSDSGVGYDHTVPTVTVARESRPNCFEVPRSRADTRADSADSARGSVMSASDVVRREHAWKQMSSASSDESEGDDEHHGPKKAKHRGPEPEADLLRPSKQMALDELLADVRGEPAEPEAGPSPPAGSVFRRPNSDEKDDPAGRSVTFAERGELRRGDARTGMTDALRQHI